MRNPSPRWPPVLLPLAMIACGGRQAGQLAPPPPVSASPSSASAPSPPTPAAKATCKPLDTATFDPGGHFLVTVGTTSVPASTNDPPQPIKDGLIDVLAIPTGMHVASLDLGEPRVPSPVLLAWSPDSDHLVCGGQAITTNDGGGHAVKIWDTNTWSERVVGQSAYTGALVLSADGARAAVVGAFANGKVFEVATGLTLVDLPGAAASTDLTVGLSADGTALLLGGSSATELRRVADGKVVATWDCGGSQTLSPRGDLWAIDCGGETSIVDARTGKKLHTLAPAAEMAPTLSGPIAWSPDGARVASWVGAGDGTSQLQIWDAKSGRRLGMFKVATATPYSLTFSPDSKYFVLYGTTAVDTGRRAELWDAATLSKLRDIDGGPQPLWRGQHELLASGMSFQDAQTGASTSPRPEVDTLTNLDATLTLSNDKAYIAVSYVPGIPGVAGSDPEPGVVRLVRLTDGAVLELAAIVVDGVTQMIARRADGSYQGPDAALACLPPRPGKPSTKLPSLFADFFPTRHSP